MTKGGFSACFVGLVLAACAPSSSTSGTTTPAGGGAGGPPGALLGTIDESHVLVDLSTNEVTPLGHDGWHMTWGPFQDHHTMLVEGDDSAGPAPTLIVHASGAEATRGPAGLKALSPDGAWGYLSPCPSAPTACLAPLVDGRAGTPVVVLPDALGIPVAWTPDGELVLDDIGEEVGDPGIVTIVRVADGSTVRSFPVETQSYVDASADGAWIAWGNVEDNAILVAAITDPEHPKTFPFPSTYAAACVFAMSDTRLVCSLPANHETDDDRTLVSIDLATGTSVVLTDHAFSTDPVASPDGRSIAWSEVVDREERFATSPADHADVHLLLPDRAGKQLVDGWIR